MTKRSHAIVDGNEAAARIAYLASEVVAIYPITPASPMGELADQWAAEGQKNLWGEVPEVIEMQSEAGAAGAVHGALQAGALSTTFTASQGLLLMIPDMFKIAGELTPAAFHIAARTIATHALSIFGDHSDVMAARSTGWAMIASASVQEAQDLALAAHAATLEARVPFLHFFDGFRTSHELAKIEMLSEGDVRALIDDRLVRAHRERALTPDRPVLRGSAQNPDVFFQAREAANPYYLAVPGIVERVLVRFAELTGRRYRLFDYVGAPDAERVLVLMGSGVGAAVEAVERLAQRGEKVGMIVVRLYRPFDAARFSAALPRTARRIAVLDRTKEPGAVGDPLYLDVVAALAEERGERAPMVAGGRYGLASKEFTPEMAEAVLAELAGKEPKRHFSIGIKDDVTGASLPWDDSGAGEPSDVIRAVFYGLGSDGTVSANKNSVKIVGEGTDLFAQGYFVYDSKKAGSVTVSHLRFSPRPIRSTYLIRRASFVACHQFSFLDRMDVLQVAGPGATFLLASPFGPDEVWERLPAEVKRSILDKELRFFVVDAHRVAREAGLEGRVNTVLQVCFFALSGILPRDEAIRRVKETLRKSYGKRGEAVVAKNEAAVDAALSALHEVRVRGRSATGLARPPAVSPQAPDFVRRVTAAILEGKGDFLPVSAFPPDGTWPVSTARWEKRGIAQDIPIWDPDLCTDCGLCAFVCPHAAIRMKVFEPAALGGAPASFASKEWGGKEYPGWRVTVQVAPDDCTGCGGCVDVCPARSKERARHKAIDMEPRLGHVERERANFDFFLGIPELDRNRSKFESVKGSQLLEPLFEYSGACAGCGETPYLKLLTQLFGDRIVVANATGCSSIYGGNLPTTPWCTNREGRGPAWANSLFEDNAEFGLGMRLAFDRQREHARSLVGRLARSIGEDFAAEILSAPQDTEEEIARQRGRVASLVERLAGLESPDAANLAAVADHLVKKSVWIVGGDGWAYDIGFGGLDHTLASGKNVRLLVLDTEVYSNTGGQASKSTPRGAVAKFASGGKQGGKKDLGMIAMAYGNVYVAQIAFAANPLQTIRAFLEAESYAGAAILIAYSHCIAHGIDMSTAMTHQKEAATSGYWPLYRYDPRGAANGGHPFHLDSRKPAIPFRQFAMKEGRFAMLAHSNPAESERLLDLAQMDIDGRWRYYEQMAGIERTLSEPMEEAKR